MNHMILPVNRQVPIISKNKNGALSQLLNRTTLTKNHYNSANWGMHLTQPDTRYSVMGIWKTIPKAWLNSKNDLPVMKLAEITCSSCAGKTVSPVLNAEVEKCGLCTTG